MKHLSYTERKIIRAVITTALEREYVISVNDGEQWTVKRSNDRKTIETAIGTTEETILQFSAEKNGRIERIGMMHLTHSNDEDVIADTTDNEAMTTLCTTALARTGQ